MRIKSQTTQGLQPVEYPVCRCGVVGDLKASVSGASVLPRFDLRMRHLLDILAKLNSTRSGDGLCHGAPCKSGTPEHYLKFQNSSRRTWPSMAADVVDAVYPKRFFACQGLS